MKTEFYILWVDDNLEFADSIKMGLSRWLENQGFELIGLMHDSPDNVIKDIENHEIELIIVDYKLGAKKGDKLIEEIRDKEFYQDIVFYSADEDGPPPIQFDGVFYLEKKDAGTRIKELIELKLRRVSDPASIRGWILADSIELEVMLTNLLSRCFGENKGHALPTRILHPKGRPLIDFGAKNILFSGTVKDLIGHLKRQEPRDDQRISKLEKCKEILDKFDIDVIHVRNAIAHQQVDTSQAEKTIKTQKGPNITLKDETYTKIRKDLRKHRDNFIELSDLI